MRRIVIIGILGLLTLQMNAQRTWIETDFSAKITENFEFTLSPELRFNEGWDLKEYFIEPSLEYSINKYLKFSGGYRLGYNINKKDEREGFGRFRLDAKTGLKWMNFRPKFRIRYTNGDDFTDDDDEETEYLRYKFSLGYKLDKIKTEPYVAYEWYRDLEAQEFNKARFEAGFLYKLNNHHKVGAYYRTNNYLVKNKETVKIIGISYKFSL